LSERAAPVLVEPKKTPTQASVGPVRRCACGGVFGPDGICETCRAKRSGLQRSPISSKSAPLVPPVVHEVLRSPGQPLAATTRAVMDRQFGFNFAHVRVHADAKAAQSAEAVGAKAYTVGRNLVFGKNQYTPNQQEGKRLIAHELTHVVQQDGVKTSMFPTELSVAPSNDNFEREAELAGREFTSESVKHPKTFASSPTALQRQGGDPIPVDLVPSDPVPGMDLPKVSAETWRLIGGDPDKAGKSLSDPERQKIAAITKERIPSGPPLAFTEGPRFILHDTAGLLGAAKLQEEKAQGRGPLGAGVTAFVPRTDPTVQARQQLFESQRPTTTEFEKSSDIIGETAREQAFRKVWKAASASEQTGALDRALASLGLSADEIAKEQQSAKSQLNATSGKIFTTASWAVKEICARVATAGVGAPAVAASPPKEKDLTDGCKELANYYTTRTARVGSAVTVEILQETGLKDPKGNQNACNPKNPNLKPLPKPAYTDHQYQEIMMLYLRATLQAGKFPEITTHFSVDAFKQGHCDPRCFDLGRLYKLIASTLGHGQNSTYGVKPSYGTKYGTDNIWWDDTICGGGHP
jgi:Domain of unknown function (DUF4157)